MTMGRNRIDLEDINRISRASMRSALRPSLAPAASTLTRIRSPRTSATSTLAAATLQASTFFHGRIRPAPTCREPRPKAPSL
jgi:hypothetical protein